jgi:hypothetical protein
MFSFEAGPDRATLCVTFPGRKIGDGFRRKEHMSRERALQLVLGLVGVLFVALSYPMVVFVRQEPALSMMLSLYVTLGIFLLLAIRRPAAYRSVIAFTAWSSLVHALLMGTQALEGMVARGELIGVGVLILIGIAFLALAPAKLPVSAG